MSRSRPAPDLRPFYLLLVGVGGIAAHLASEFGAMGFGANGVLLSPRHWYLGLAVVAGIVVFVVRGRALWSQSANGRDFKRMLHVGLEALPLRGKGTAFYAATAAAQFGVGMMTEAGEGAPIAGHDVAAGVLGALLVVVLLAFFAKAVVRTLPAIVEVLAHLLPASMAGSKNSIVARAREADPVVRLATWYPQLFNRPPPRLQLATASS